MNNQENQENQNKLTRRWRLMLGKYSDNELNQQGLADFSEQEQKLSRSLDFLYQHEYKRRGVLQDSDLNNLNNQNNQNNKGGSLDKSQLTAINWLNYSRKLFPKSTFERMQQHALERYELSDLLKKPEVIQSLEPNINTAKVLMSLRGQLSEDTRMAVKNLIEQVVRELVEKIRPKFTQAFQGYRNRLARSPIRQAQNFDWRKTIQSNLKNYSTQLDKIIIQEPRFYSRVQKKLDWEIVLCVDESGSMLDSVMYAAVCASILANIPSVKTHLIIFDTQVVDLSHLVHDPVEVLLTIQLGGGTYIGQAMRYCAQKITNPDKTIFVLISDFAEGASPQEMLKITSSLHEQGCILLGLAALDNSANPVYDREMAQKLAQRGMKIGAMTPEHLADWLAGVINQ